MNTIIDVFIYAQLVIGLGSLIYIIRFGKGSSWIGLILFTAVISFTLIILITYAFQTSNHSTYESILFANVFICLSTVILAVTASAMTKHLSHHLDRMSIPRIRKFVLSSVLLVAWAGISSATVSGAIRFGFYQSGLTHYEATGAALRLSNQRRENELTELRNKTAICRAAQSFVNELDSDLIIGQSITSWLKSLLTSTRHHYVSPIKGDKSKFQIEYKEWAARGERGFSIQMASYTFIDVYGRKCVINGQTRDAHEVIDPLELRGRLQNAVGSLSNKVSYLDSRALEWEIVIADEVLRELGFESLKLTPLDDLSRTVDRSLKRFNKFFLASILLFLIAPLGREAPG